jgi:CPA1 family monovalent cation:H+ antiporter
LKLWHISVLLFAGLVIGEARPAGVTGFFQFATLYLFLPALIFEAAWHLDLTLVRRAWAPIVLLAVPGVLVTVGIIALVVHAFGGIGWGAALVLGAVLSATDPVAVSAIFRRLRVPPALETIVESESLLNDAIAVVAYRTIIAALTVTMSVSSLTGVGVTAILGSLGAIVIGIAIGVLAAYGLHRRLPSFFQTLVTFAAAYASYFVCTWLGWSGIFAVIAVAMTMRELERRHEIICMSDRVENTWHVAATIANAALFFLVAASVEPSTLWIVRGALIATTAGVLLARAIVAYGLMALRPKMVRSWKTVVRLAGVRGALSLALALGIPATLADRDVVIAATFTVVIVTLLIGTLTYERRIGRLDLENPRV